MLTGFVHPVGLSASALLRVLVPLLLATAAACAALPPRGGGGEPASPNPSPEDRSAGAASGPGANLDGAAESYVQLVLSMGKHDADYVDAFFGSPDLKEKAEKSRLSLPEIRARADQLAGSIEAGSPESHDSMLGLRRNYLVRQLRALISRTEMLEGRRFRFDEESRAFYDAVAPVHSEDHFVKVLDRLEGRLPGEGSLSERYQAFRKEFIIPPDRIDTVFQAAIRACRERTARYISIPEGEKFTLEYVKDKPWSGYNWYQGNFSSLIQVNTSLPVHIDRALDLACHEGYPGHHLYNVLREHELVRGRGWKEFTIYPLFSPQSLIAEGSANYGIRIAFPGEDRIAFEREVLFPLAGLDPAGADEYYRVQDLVRDLGYAGNEAARRYLDGSFDAAGAVEWLTRYALMSGPSAEQRLRFFEKYRSYVINYNLGEDLVKQYVEAKAGPGAPRETTWRIFRELLASPRLPSDLTPDAG